MSEFPYPPEVRAYVLEPARWMAVESSRHGITVNDDGSVDGYIEEFARCPRADSAVSEEAPVGSVGPGSAPRAALTPVTPSGYRVDSAAHRRRRIALRRNVYRCRTSALLMCVVMAGAFAADRPVAGVLSSALVFILLRTAAEARAEL